MNYKYYKSDFQLIVGMTINRQTEDGSIVPITTASDFTLRFFVNGQPENGYIASKAGSVLKNCMVLDESHIAVFFDRSQIQLPVGKLKLEAEFTVTDHHYESDSTCNIVRLYNTGITLTDQPDLDDEGKLQTDIINPSYTPCNCEEVNLASESDVNNIFNM